MSRHRDVRSMNYSEEYDGYDDVYGHSMEDDYCVSPSVEQFLFDRSKQQNIASFITEPDIVEDNEDVDESPPSSNEEKKYNLSELERAKLISCLETIRNVIGDTVSDSKLREKIVLSNFDANVALDAILKESSPKQAVDSAKNKKQLERHPGVSVDKSNTPTHVFTIPRFSFKKQENLSKDSSCQLNNVDSSKDVNHSLKTVSSLAELVSRHAGSVNSDTTKMSSQNDTNTQPFSSLAALTADYLQKSNVADRVESRDRHQSSVSQFIIPKLSIKEMDSEETKNLPKLHNNENSKRQVVFANSSGRREVDSLQKDFANMDIFPENNINVTDIKSREQIINPISIANEICTPSPRSIHDDLMDANEICIPSPRSVHDDWIDLSTALKEAEFLTDSTFCNVNLTTSRKLYHDMHNLEISLEDDNRVTPNMLPVTLNLRALRRVKLPHTKNNVSVFGKTLCKKWRTKRPVLRDVVQHYNTVKPFDFSTPYRNRS
ncbi:PREDICTED: uncharacterized protein LOC105458170 [Wasmannia auropunctata]|uniref:uncharacterized protein LOC105458170 n=1 Tax=Wasmannia auropunctata TaxID=64793 RepID=UPI0005F09CC3|nr:PREDICTED: uncharacterized protein LOC105458170 [Wasmannia auropunctata]